MSGFAGPISAGLAGTTGAQKTTSAARKKQEEEEAEATRKFDDAFELQVKGVETTDAVRSSDEHPSQQTKDEEDGTPHDMNMQQHVPPPHVLGPPSAQPPGESLDVTG
ncbi:MAG: hypothetical protein D8M59_02910 [Planctomycetes bacterium]|nr:hypothetical protein [Planctomycetota bacterium]NOG52946.1 hypothetical protein [Planctomycetota bacterium]